jgi:hypothetical protein
MSNWRDNLEPDLGRSRADTWITCERCGLYKKVFSAAAVNSNTCESCLPDNEDPELQRLLRDDAFRRGVSKWADYKRVAATTLPNGRWVSTVWLGFDYSFGDGPPLIFETMVFPSERDMGELDCERYSTEEAAKKGHERMCAKWSAESVDVEA